MDVVMFVGGFDLTELFTSLEKKVSAIKSNAIERGLISEEEWQGIVKNLKEK
jgi:replicative DNA helicase